MASEKTLYIPVNIRRRKEIVEGFGYQELRNTVIGTLAGFIIGLILFIIKDFQVLYLALVPILFMIASIVFLRKDARNMNTIDQIKLVIDFYKSQKRFYYVYTNIYEIKVEHDKNK